MLITQMPRLARTGSSIAHGKGKRDVNMNHTGRSVLIGKIEGMTQAIVDSG